MAAPASVPSATGNTLRETLVVAALALAAAWFISGTSLTYANDDGIYPEGARAILQGKTLYKDHFAFTGPGSYWILALAFKLLGVTLAVSRIPLILSFAMMTGATYWITAKISSRLAACVTSYICFTTLISNPGQQFASHRWDSSALCAVSVALAMHAISGARPWVAALAGACAAYAAWCTPTVALPGALLAIWMFRAHRFWPYATGVAVVSVSAFGYLALSGSLMPMIDSFLWAQANYGESNHVGYAMVHGGAGRAFKGSSGVEALFTGFFFAGMMIPAALPFINIAGVAAFRNRASAAVWMIFAASSALVLSTYPRMDIGHLLNVCALPLALAGFVFTQTRFTKPLVVLACIWCGLIINFAVTQRIGKQQVATHIGSFHAIPEQIEAVKYSQSHVPAGSAVFVYPYLPTLYFLTAGVNPTPHPFLQPGMMTDREEANTLVHLQRHPPEHIFYMHPTAEQILFIWPTTDPNRINFKRLEGWIHANYEFADDYYGVAGYRLMKRRAATVAAR